MEGGFSASGGVQQYFEDHFNQSKLCASYLFPMTSV